MNLSQLPYIIAIANTKSLSAAAQQVGLSQPALSKYLAKLERELGLELFYRKKKQLRPTQAGRVYLTAAYRILSIQQQAVSTIRSVNSTQRKQIRIGITPHQGVQVIADLYPPFKQCFPSAEFAFFEGYTEDIYEAVRSGKTDYGITTFLPGNDDLEILPLFDEDLLLSVPVFHNLAVLSSSDQSRLAEISLSEFCDSPFVLMDETTTIGQLSRRAIEEAGFQPTVVFSSTNGFMVDKLIRAGAGVGFAPFHYVVPSKEVVYFRLNPPVAFRCCVIRRKDRVPSKEERYLSYLQLKAKEHDRNIRFCWSDELRSLVDEFEAEDVLVPTADWRL